MSELHTPQQEANTPSFEPWLAVLLASFIPAVLTVYVADAFHLPLIVVTAITVVIGFVMLVQHTRRTAAAVRDDGGAS